ncbi:transposase [Leucobacter aridicollis]|nr:transposase [Leucobacter aridicollis]
MFECRKRAGAALIAVVASRYLAGDSTRRIDNLVNTIGIHSLSKSRVFRMADGVGAVKRSGCESRRVGPGRPGAVSSPTLLLAGSAKSAWSPLAPSLVLSK